MASKKTGKKPLTFKNRENYFPMLVRGENVQSSIQKDVFQFYEKRYGSESLEGFAVTGSSKEAAFGSGVGPISSGAPVAVTVPQPYIPEFASPDRLFFPTDPKEAMKYWRYFYALDPVCGNVIDMYAEMLMSDMELAGEGVEDEIKEACYLALDETNALSKSKWLTTGLLVDGEVVPHLIWDEDKGRWSYMGFQDPLNLRVFDIPFANTEPYIEMMISDDVRQILRNPDPKFDRFRENVPEEFLELIYQGKGVPLDTEENVTFIPRKLSAYDMRGISIFSRLWRILIYEDAIFNASIQTARRHAAPVKVVKLGDPAKGWIPGVEHEEKLRKLLAVAETDPHAWLVYHYGVQFEAWGTTDRVMGISREWDIIERIKLIALGVSRAFLHGEVTYASAEKGLQIFLDRLQGLRTFFETSWWYPRFFGVMAMKNDWIEPTEAEIAHRVRTRRSKVELIRDNRYIVPTMVWSKTLDGQKKDDLVRAYGDISERFGIHVSRSEVSATVGLDWEEQERKYREENKQIEEMDKELGPAEAVPEAEGMGVGAPAGAPGGIGPAPSPIGEEGEVPIGEEEVGPAEEGEVPVETEAPAPAE